MQNSTQTQETIASRVGRFGPPVTLMAVIFLLSNQSDLSTGLGRADFILRKLAHMTIFGSLWWLWLRALRFRWPFGALVITFVYSISDEFHQSFIAGRHASPVDVLIDLTGIGVAATIWRFYLRRRHTRHT